MPEASADVPQENPRGWLSECCRPGYRSTELPWRAEWNGASWDCASNGHAIVFLQGATVPEREGAPPLDKVTEPRPARWHTVSFSRLRAWAECSLIRVQCASCKGRGSLFGWDGCPGCDGEGANPPPAAPGMLFGRAIDRRILWRYIRHLALEGTDSCNVGIVSDSVEGAVWITSGSWMVIQMPMRFTSQGDCECPPFDGKESAA